MKIAVFEVKDWEKQYFQQAAASNRYDLELSEEKLTAGLAASLVGVDAVSVMESVLDANVLDTMKSRGIRFITTRTIGYDLIDVEHAKSAGFRIANARYPSDAVAEFTILLMLMCLRHYKASLYRVATNDYSLAGLKGKELGKMTVGVVGTGGIGACVVRLLAGFGCKILAYNKSQKPDLAALVEYTDMDSILRQSDIITFHIPLTSSTRHTVNDESLAKMKDGVILINTARGELMRTETLIAGVESEKIGALGLDVFEEEREIYHRYRTTDIIKNRNMAYLRQFPNVVMTQHMAFFTETNIRSMVCDTLDNLLKMHEGQGYYEI